MPEFKHNQIDEYKVIELHNDKLIAAIAPGYGACLISLQMHYNGEWVEVMFGANEFPEKIMGGRSPVLFPAIGPSVLDGERFKYRHQGEIYKMPAHGFAKEAEWKVVDEYSDNSKAGVTMELTATREWIEHYYPYDFALRITYQIEDNKLLTRSEVTNKSDKSMPFALGFHPYFKTPIFPDRASRDDSIIKVPGRTYFRLLPDGPTGEILPIPENETLMTGTTLPDYHWVRIVNDLDVIENGMTRCEIRDQKANVSIFLEFNPEDYETATLYAPVDSEFVCIEPRTGIPMCLSDDTPARPTGKWLSPAGESGDSITLDWITRIETE